MNHLYLLKTLLIGGGCMLVAQFLQAQDPIFSQYFAQKMYLNPAYTGYDYGIAVNTALRTQMLTLAEDRIAEFTTSNLEMGAEVSHGRTGSGFGGQYTQSTQGEGPYQFNRAGVSYAFHSWPCAGDYRKRHNVDFALGLQLAYNWTSLNGQDLVFRTSLNPVYGQVGPSGLSGIDPNYANFVNDQYFDLAAGGLLRFYPRATNQARQDMLVIGAAFHHVPPNRAGNFPFFPNPDSVTNSRGQSPTRYTFHGSYRIGNADGPQVIPMVKIEFRKASPQSWDYVYWSNQIGVLYQSGRVSDGIRAAWFGGWLHGRYWGSNPPTGSSGFTVDQSIYSLILAGGLNMQYDRYNLGRFGISYDFNVFSGFNDFGGTVELFLSFNIGQLGFYRNSCDPRCSTNQ